MVNLSRIAPEVPVSNLQGSIDYYQKKLGFRLAMQVPDGEYAIVERDDVAIHLFQDNARSSSPVGIHIFTQDLRRCLPNCSTVVLLSRRKSYVSRGGTAISVFMTTPGTLSSSQSRYRRAINTEKSPKSCSRHEVKPLPPGYHDQSTLGILPFNALIPHAMQMTSTLIQCVDGAPPQAVSYPY